MEMEDNNSSISETPLDVHAEKDCTCIKDNTNNIEEHDLTLDKGILHSIDKGNGGMPSASFQGTIDEGLGDSFVKDDLSNSEKADGRRKRRKCRVARYRGKRTKSANTSKKTEIDECAMVLKPPGSSLPMKSASEIVQKSSPVSCILTMTPETMQKEVEEFISPDSGIATLCPWSNSLEVTPSSGFESCTEYGKTPSATKRGNATEVEQTDLKNIIDEQTEVDLVRKLQRNYIRIKSEIDPLCGLADELLQAEIIGEQGYEKIRSARDMTKRSADLLLKSVAYNITPLKLKKLIFFLRKCKYDYIADLLQNNSNQNLNRYSDLSQVSNFKNLQRKFGKLKKLLLKDFDPKYVIDELLEMEVISFIDHEDIWTTQFNEQRIDCVLKCVKRNIEINLGPFCCILRKHSEWLAEEIDLLSNDPESSDDSDANAVLELSCKKGNWTGHIEGPFKSIPDFNIRTEFKTEKIQNVADDVVRRQGDSTNLSLDVTLSKVHCKCDRVDKGSIIVRLHPLSIRALQKLKDSKPEDVMAIMKCLLTNEDLKKLEAAKLTSVEIKIEALDSTLPNPISLKEEGISKEAIVDHFTYLSTCMPDINEFIPAFLQDVQISDESKASLKKILSMKKEDWNEAFLSFLLQEKTERPRIIFKQQLRKMEEISLLKKLDNRNEIVLREELGKVEIQMNYSYLLDELDGREFLKIFSEKGFCQEKICDKILRSRNRRERTKVFIDFVLESEKDARDLIFQELEYKHQTIYYVLISTKRASKPSAESLSTLVAMKAAICERYDEVIGETEPKAYRDAFVERKIFTDKEFQDLVKICPKENRAAAFLKTLLNGNNVFALKTFLWVLKRTGNESLANGLENDFYKYDGEEVNSPDIDGTNKCTLMTAVLEAQIIVGKESQNNCSEDGYPLLEYPLECNPTELVDHTDQKVITCMQFSKVEKIESALCGRRNCLPSPETSPKKTISQDEEDTGAHPIYSEYDMLPPEILNMDERFQTLYTEALAAGKEKVHNIRVMIVGQEGVGKTSLTHRLLGEEVKENETESTEGIDVHTRCCQIDHVTKTWTRTIKTDELYFNDQRIVSILNNYVKPTNTELTEVMMPDPVNAISPVINSKSSPHDPLVVLPRTLDEDMQSPGEESGFTAEESCDVPISHIAHVNNKRKRKRCTAEIQKFFKRAKSLPVPKSGLSDVTFLDFAGQSIFSTTHQAFMSWRTLYLLVTDMSLPLTDAVLQGIT